jgi:hypothetical protein
MEPYDLILCPVFPCPAVRHDKTDSEGLWEGVSYTTPFSLTGLPAAVVRCASSTEGLPIGVQIVARPWCDHVALAAAAYLENRARRLVSTTAEHVAVRMTFDCLCQPAGSNQGNASELTSAWFAHCQVPPIRRSKSAAAVAPA